jgi:peptidoglycan/xylan/chitin deacetylase (PgdA/CDA1 family)
MKAILKSLLGARGCFVVKWLWIRFLAATGLLRYAQRRIARSGGVVVLTFHRVLPESQCRSTYSLNGMLVQNNTFEALARYVSKHFSVISLVEQPAWTPDDPRPRIAFTFDDGWIDNFEYAAPIARQYDIPLSIFICPSKVGLPLPYWPERLNALACKLRSSESAVRQADKALEIWAGRRAATLPSLSSSKGVERFIELLKRESKSEREHLLDQITAIANTVTVAENENADATMTWENIQSLLAAGTVFGSHTNSHEILPSLPLSEVERELANGKKELENRLRQPCLLFAYPNGDWSQKVRNLVGQAGHKLAFINKPGIWTSKTDPLLIPRNSIWEGRLVGPAGRFSPAAFQYATFWWAYRSQKANLANRNVPCDLAASNRPAQPEPSKTLRKLTPRADSQEGKPGCRAVL